MVTTILAWALMLALAIPSLMFVLECLLGLFSGPKIGPEAPSPSFAVIVPAHNEERGIAATIAAVREQLRPGDRLIVVADNCTDRTLETALSCGAEVVERDDPLRVGKGYALSAGRQALQAAPPDVAIILDADCIPQPEALQRLAAATSGNSVVQGLYLLHSDTDARARTAISTFAFLVKNRVRQRGLARLGAPALLQGTGMAFPWGIFADAPLASGEIVEDLELGLKLALKGTPIRFVERAAFVSPASSGSALLSQRTRWEHGSMGMAFRHLPALAGAALRGQMRLVPLLLDLLVPPFAMLMIASLTTALAATTFAVVRGDMALGLFAIGVLAALMLTVIVTWLRFGRAVLPFHALLCAPAYLLWKIPIYARFITAPERRWIRTGRE